MSSALNAWRGQSNAVFEEIERIHREVGGQKPGRRYLTRQINYAYVALLAAHFQGYCRAVHSEAIQILVAEVSDPALGAVLEGRLN